MPTLNEPVDHLPKKEREALRKLRAKIVKLSKLVKTQEQLNRMLLDIPNRVMRREVYEMIRPLLKFPHTYDGELASYHHVEPPEPITS